LEARTSGRKSARHRTGNRDGETVEFGIHTGQQDIELDELRKLLATLRRAGFDLITVWDHFYESPRRR